MNYFEFEKAMTGIGFDSNGHSTLQYKPFFIFANSELNIRVIINESSYSIQHNGVLSGYDNSYYNEILGSVKNYIRSNKIKGILNNKDE